MWTPLVQGQKLRQQAGLMKHGDPEGTENKGLWTVMRLQEKQHWRLFHSVFLCDLRISVLNSGPPTRPHTSVRPGAFPPA